MIRKLLRLAVAASVIGVVAGVAWLVYGETQTSEAAHFDESIDLVHHQTGRMSTTLGDAGTFVNQAAEISGISELIGEWAPRYALARTAYVKFYSAITAAEERAEAYFASQRALTEKYNDPDKRARAQAYDEEDYAFYGEWRDQARRAHTHAQEIMNRLDDMDTDLKKLELSSEFSFDGGAFNEVPMSITLLDEELEQFRIASENIRRITASPFQSQ